MTPVSQESQLNLIDGLAFDAFGNLMGALEMVGGSGGVVYVDKNTGLVTSLVTGISRADQIALHPSGDLFVTSESGAATTTNKVYRVSVTYDVDNVPLSAAAISLTTSQAILNPEGLAVLQASGAYGSSGDLYVAEDAAAGRIWRIDPGNGATTLFSGPYARPEGLAFGDFAGALAPGLYTAETTDDNVVFIDSAGVGSTFGSPAAVGLSRPDNVEFGPDGFLYVSEDRPQPGSRVLRIAPDGTHEVVATGFGQAAGLTFDANGDLYVAEQDFDRIWRIRFASAPEIPALSRTALLALAALLVMIHRVGVNARRGRGGPGGSAGSGRRQPEVRVSSFASVWSNLLP
ncbi:MAG: hypothetical protein ACE5FL_13845 [Myxococcota bacterium]